MPIGPLLFVDSTAWRIAYGYFSCDPPRVLLRIGTALCGGGAGGGSSGSNPAVPSF